MKNKKILFITIFSSLMLYISFSSFQTGNSGLDDEFKYTGVRKCVKCHETEKTGNQYDIWQGSKHSLAWYSLLTPKADNIAKDMGFNTKASQTPQCIKCHVLGKDINYNELQTTFNIEDGVQCETCHGPGSRYSFLPIMKDKEWAGEFGLIIHKEKEQFCISCHNSDSPTYNSSLNKFDYDRFWEKIKHPLPSREK